MREDTRNYLAIYLNNIEVFDYIGSRTVDEKELQKKFPSLDMSTLEPLVDYSDSNYKIKFDFLRMFLQDVFENIVTGLLDYSFLTEFVRKNYPDYSVCKLTDIESEEHQSYKFLFENISEKYNSLNEEFYSQLYKLQTVESELATKNLEIKKLKNSKDNFEDSAAALKQFIENLLSNEIVISNTRALDAGGDPIVCSTDNISVKPEEISLRPGVYDSTRPSWFSEIRYELNKLNAAKKVAESTSSTFFDLLKKANDLKKMDAPLDIKANEYEKRRKQEIIKLISDTSLSNEEKYLKYILLTPGLSRDYLKTLDGAADLCIDAKLVIKLLEQPKETFNKEIIEAYISRAHKGTEYNIKQELAEELIKGQWSIVSDINGKREKFQLVPFELLSEIADRLKKILIALDQKNSAEFVLNNIPEDSTSDAARFEENIENPDEDDDSASGDAFDTLWESELEAQFSDFDKGVI
ncbi:MAG: hypothetical protein Q4E51_05420 [Lachnospiraceae bacterium]|nr:hypothetical protein [Lachnospiraceae bacterium]